MADIQQASTLMERLLEENTQVALPQVGDTTEGTVITASKHEVHLDINGIVSGVVRGPELFDESGEFSNLKVGDQVIATVLELENENGELELSFRQAGHRKAWDNLITLRDANTVVDAIIMDANKGGLIIRVGNVAGFLPVSQLSVEHYPRVEGGNKNKILERLLEYVGSAFRVKVIDVDEVQEKLIVSEKLAKAEQQQQKIAAYNVGDVVEGKITGVVDFGAFVEFGEGLEGLVHISEIAWQRIDDPNDFVSVGDNVKAEIISIDDSKISLSIRNLLRDPWAHVAEKYTIGENVTGKVLKVNPFGVFVELDQDIHGLCHISELSYRKLSSPSEILTEGQEAEFKVISIEPDKHRLGLSYKVVHEKRSAESTDEAAEEKTVSEPVAATEAAGEATVEPEVAPVAEEPVAEVVSNESNTQN